MEVTPSRKSPRLSRNVIVVNNTLRSSSRPSFDINACASSPHKTGEGLGVKKSYDEFINVSSSKSYNNITSKRKGKGEIHEANLLHDSDFEDEMPLSKRAKLKEVTNLSAHAKAKSAGNKGKIPSGSLSKKQVTARSKKSQNETKV